MGKRFKFIIIEHGYIVQVSFGEYPGFVVIFTGIRGKSGNIPIFKNFSLSSVTAGKIFFILTTCHFSRLYLSIILSTIFFWFKFLKQKGQSPVLFIIVSSFISLGRSARPGVIITYLSSK